MRNVVIVDSKRTGLAKAFRGSFNATRPDDMGAHLINVILDRNPNVDPGEIDDVVAGCSMPEGAQGMNIGRTIAVLSNLPVSVSGFTVNRFCSSGLQAIAIAANQIASGVSDMIIAGGVESVSLTQGKTNQNDVTNPRLKSTYPGIYMTMGQTAEIVARRYKISRGAQDEFALVSQERTAQAQERDVFIDEIVPMNVDWHSYDKSTGQTKIINSTVDRDECNRPQTSLEQLLSLPSAFEPEDGSVTAGNSSQLSDGASMTLLMSEQKALDLNLEPIAYFRGFSVAGCEPDEMGIGPIYAVPKLLRAKGLGESDIDLWEINEAFASQAVYCRDALNIHPDTLNVNGGSISIGHPFGMTGSRMVGHIARELRRRNKRYGVVTMCVGGGMGAAGLVEAYS